MKYFAKVPFLQAELGKRPSYAWRSILVAKEIIVRGSRWNVGNGAEGAHLGRQMAAKT